MHLRSASMVEQKEEDSQASEYLGADMGEEDSISRRAERGSPVILSQPQTTIPPSLSEDTEGDVVPTSREEVQRPGFATRYEEGTGFTLFPSPEDTTTSEPEIRSSSCRPIAPAPPGHQRPQVSQSLQNWVADRPSGPWSPVQRNDDALHSDHDQSPGNNLRGKYPTDRNYPDKMGEEFGKMEQEKEEKEESEEDGKRRNKKKRARREKRKGHWGMQSDRKLRQRKDGDGDRNGGSGGGQSMTVR